MTKGEIVVTISLPWWTIPYMRFCTFFAAIHGLEPDAEKIAGTVVKHVRVRTA